MSLQKNQISNYNILFVNPVGGLSGDMFLGAFLDLGLPPELLRQGLARVGLQRFFELKLTTVKRHQIAARKVDFPALPDALIKPAPRTLDEVAVLLKAAGLPAAVLEFSLRVFNNLAAAEAKVHGIGVDQVHFHEVGDYDTIADIVGTAIALDWLKPEYLSLKAIPLGSGTVDCAHGCLPVPVPAVMVLLEDLPVYESGIKAELVTPTGAALIKSLVEILSPFTEISYNLGRRGYGAGSRDLCEKPNLLCLSYGYNIADAAAEKPGNQAFNSETLITLETLIDDMTPEKVAYLQESLLVAGALEVVSWPVYMKKGRLGNSLLVLLKPDLEIRITEQIFRESSTLGIRRFVGERYFLQREITVQATSFGEIRCKTAWDKTGRLINMKLEHDDLVRLALNHNLPLTRLEQLILAELSVLPIKDRV